MRSCFKVGAAFGAAGQRCMALSTAVFVGESRNWIPDLVERAKKLKVNAGTFNSTTRNQNKQQLMSAHCVLIGHIADTDLGPVISPEAKQRIKNLVQSGINEGATCILDGRDIVVPGFEQGNFVGPTILTNVKVGT